MSIIFIYLRSAGFVCALIKDADGQEMPLCSLRVVDGQLIYFVPYVDRTRMLTDGAPQHLLSRSIIEAQERIVGF
ncbi:hypothetical protein ACU4GD_21860 [Cupriavidus basilensis]